MTSYPGEDPQRPEDRSEDEPGTEPTQPVGYWERRAAEQEQNPPTSPSGAVFNPTSAQPTSGWPQPGDAPGNQQGGQAWQQPYAQQPYAQQPYTQPGYQPGYPPPGGQSGYPPQGPGDPPYAFSPPRPDQPQANLAMILGIVGLVGGFMCGLGFIASPFAWGLGRNALKEIHASQGRLGGEGPAKAGQITGIIGTVFLAIGVLLLIGFIILLAAGVSTSDSTGNV